MQASSPTGETKSKTSITSYLVVIASFTFLLLSFLLAWLSYGQFKQSFYDYSDNLCLANNTLISHVIDGDFVEAYAKNPVVDDEYLAFCQKLDEMIADSDVSYFYIMADIGDPDHYMFVYDNDPESSTKQAYNLGGLDSKINYDGSSDVLANGTSFTEARYYEGMYGELYYAYAPIKNSAGEVVAFLGTDIDISLMHTRLGSFRTTLFIALLITFFIFAFVFAFFMHKLLTKPLRNVTQSMMNLSQGNLSSDVPEGLASRSKETGQISEAYVSVSNSISGLIEDIQLLMDSVRAGHLAKRADLSKYDGEFYRIIDGVNKTMDVVCSHFDDLPEAIAIMGRRGDMRYFNLSMMRFAQSLDATDDILYVLLPGKAHEVLEYLMHFEDESYSCEIEMERNGEMENYSLSIVRVQVDDIQPGDDRMCYMLLLHDVTSLTRARTEAELASRAKSDFLSRMSHEIRTPLNAIVGMSQIARNTNSIGKINDCLQKIEDSSDHLTGIINDILDFSKIEAGKLTLDTVEFSLIQSLDFVVSMLRSKAAEKQIEFELDSRRIAHDGITTDLLRLRQVLINLVSNAIKFTDRGGKITLLVEELSFREGRGIYRFAVTDNGIGIEPERIEKLFAPFEQANSSISTRYGGTGLGLSISNSIVAMMGGKLRVDSKLNEGSTFQFTLAVPATEKAPLPEAEGEDGGFGSIDCTNHTALVVDDIEINREIVIELLRDTNLNIITAENGQEALDMYLGSETGAIELVLMDMQMPIMDGYTATEHIRNSGREDAFSINIYAMTANAMREDVLRAQEAGMNGHIAKPLDIVQLFEILQKVFA